MGNPTIHKIATEWLKPWHKPKKNESFLLRISRTTMSPAAREYLKTHDWDDTQGTFEEGVELAHQLNTRITLAKLTGHEVYLVYPDGTYDFIAY